MGRRVDSRTWVALALLLALVAGMALTLWAARAGRIRSRHGVLGRADTLPGAPVASLLLRQLPGTPRLRQEAPFDPPCGGIR